MNDKTSDFGGRNVDPERELPKSFSSVIDAALVQQATAHATLNGMCTTMTAALSHGKDLIIGHIGDSRAYLLRNGIMRRLTRDHTLAERLLDDGVSPENDRLLAELRNVLMQALGASEATVVQMWPTTFLKIMTNSCCARMVLQIWSTTQRSNLFW